jgi:amino acid transporter
MKIQKRKYSIIPETLPIFTIPTFTYIFNKFAGFVKPELEWIWWVSISLSLIIWFFVNFKIIKK